MKKQTKKRILTLAADQAANLLIKFFKYCELSERIESKHWDENGNVYYLTFRKKEQ